MRRKVIVVHQSAELYGSDKVALDVIDVLVATGFEVIVIIPSAGPLESYLQARDCKYVIAPVAKLSRGVLSLKGAGRLVIEIAKSFLAIRKIGSRQNIGFIYSNTLAVLSGAVSARLLGVPHIWHVHEIIKRPPFLRIVYQFLAFTLAKRLIFNSEASWTWLASGNNALRNKSVVIENAVKKPRNCISYRLHTDTKDASLVIGMVGRINSWKGQDLLIDAAGLIKERIQRDVRFLIVGGIPPGGEKCRSLMLEKIARSPARDAFIVRDFQEDIWSVWAEIDIAVVPSREPEPFGLVAVEAMLSQCAVVAANHGGLKEIIRHEITGLLFKPNDHFSLATEIVRLVDDDLLRKSIALNGRQAAEKRFDGTNFSKKLGDVFLRLSEENND